jgi:hypothetical protein
MNRFERLTSQKQMCKQESPEDGSSSNSSESLFGRQINNKDLSDRRIDNEDLSGRQIDNEDLSD